MSANTIRDIQAILEDHGNGAAFARGFAETYFSQAFGILPKSEIDLLVFKLLVDAKAINPEGSIFSIARALNITPAKARNILFQYQLRFVDGPTADAMILRTMASARFSVSGNNLVFGIESPLVRAAIQAKLRENGVFADISLSGEILHLPLDHFAHFITLLLTKEKISELERQLKKAGHLKRGSLVDAFKTAAEGAMKAGASSVIGEGFSQLFDELREFLFANGGIDKIAQLLPN